MTASFSLNSKPLSAQIAGEGGVPLLLSRIIAFWAIFRRFGLFVILPTCGVQVHWTLPFPLLLKTHPAVIDIPLQFPGTVLGIRLSRGACSIGGSLNLQQLIHSWNICYSVFEREEACVCLESFRKQSPANMARSPTGLSALIAPRYAFNMV